MSPHTLATRARRSRKRKDLQLTLPYNRFLFSRSFWLLMANGVSAAVIPTRFSHWFPYILQLGTRMTEHFSVLDTQRWRRRVGPQLIGGAPARLT
jgi:hypothetical protein